MRDSMDVDGTQEWEYVAEGRHHVIVRDKHSKPPHFVLRFKKRIAQHGHEVAWSPNLGSEAPWVRRFVAPQYRPLRNCRKIPVSRPVIAAVNEQYVCDDTHDFVCDASFEDVSHNEDVACRVLILMCAVLGCLCYRAQDI